MWGYSIYLLLFKGALVVVAFQRICPFHITYQIYWSRVVNNILLPFFQCSFNGVPSLILDIGNFCSCSLFLIILTRILFISLVSKNQSWFHWFLLFFFLNLSFISVLIFIISFLILTLHLIFSSLSVFLMWKLRKLILHYSTF